MTGTGGAPLAGARVTIHQAASPTWVTNFFANASGAYSGSLPSGTYRVWVQTNTPNYSNFWYGGSGWSSATGLVLKSWREFASVHRKRPKDWSYTSAVRWPPPKAGMTAAPKSDTDRAAYRLN